MMRRRSFTCNGGNGKRPPNNLHYVKFRVRKRLKRGLFPLDDGRKFDSDSEKKLQLTGDKDTSLTTIETQKPTTVTGVTVGGFYKSTDNKVEELESISNETNLPKTPAPAA